MSIELNKRNAKIIALAVMEQSVLDYYNILTGRNHTGGCTGKRDRYCNKNELEQFFRSDYFTDLTESGIYGITVMKHLQEMAEKNIPLKMPRRHNRRPME